MKSLNDDVVVINNMNEHDEDQNDNDNSSCSTSSCNSLQLKVRYDTEQYTYYYFQNNKSSVLLSGETDDDDDNEQMLFATTVSKQAHRISTMHTENEPDNNDNNADNNNNNNDDDDDDRVVVHELTVQMYYATTTVGGNLVSANHDKTGIMIWPATHWMCQSLLMNYNDWLLFPFQQQKQKEEKRSKTTTTSILELGCGCGLVGIVLAKAVINNNDNNNNIISSTGIDHLLQNHKFLYVTTDMDETTIQLCSHNFHLNGIAVTNNYNNTNTNMITSSTATTISKIAVHSDKTASNNHVPNDDKNIDVWIRSLTWGDMIQINSLQNDVHDWHTSTTISPDDNDDDRSFLFDIIFGADIVYPSTCIGNVLNQLFDTVKMLLKPNCIFYLSFCTRDGCQTPRRLIHAASNAGFAIISAYAPCDLHPSIQRKLHYPLLDSKILLLQRHKNAIEYNNTSIGITDECRIFPGLFSQIQRYIQSQQQPPEVWDQPFLDDELCE